MTIAHSLAYIALGCMSVGIVQIVLAYTPVVPLWKQWDVEVAGFLWVGLGIATFIAASAWSLVFG